MNVLELDESERTGETNFWLWAFVDFLSGGDFALLTWVKGAFCRTAPDVCIYMPAKEPFPFYLHIYTVVVPFCRKVN